MPRKGPSPDAATLPSLAGFLARRIVRQATGSAAVLLWRRPTATAPARILFAPETLAEADPAVAADIYAGVFALAGEVVDVSGGSPFDTRPPSEAWARALHGFTWLHHLEAQATELSSSNARALLDEWLGSAGSKSAVATAPDVTAERLVTWLVQSPLLLNGADPAFRQRFMRAVGRHMRRLERALVLAPRGPVRLRVAAALALAGTITADQQRVARMGLSALEDALADEVLPDGGHASRSPEAIVETLAVLIPVREALIRRQQPVPRALGEAVDRMLTMLRFFRHGDGGLAHFHGTGHVTAPAVDAVLAYDDVRGTAPANARHSGYQRIEAGGTVVIADTGRAPPPAYAAAAAASALAFEMSHGGERLVVNCGALGRARAEWADAARATAAHSTLVVGDTSSARVLEGFPLESALGPVLHAGPRSVEVERGPLAFRAVHDGYREAFGLLHERRLMLSEDGLWLEGEDRIVGQDRLDGVPFAVRFHLGAGLKVRLERSRRRALLTLPDASLWVFGVDEGPPMAIEESVVLSAPRRVRRTAQIVVAGNSLTDPVVRWHIARNAPPLAPADPDPRQPPDRP